MYLFKKVVFNCKRATFLSLKKDQGKITFFERAELSYHLLYCDPCRRFIAQSHQIDKAGSILMSKPPFSLPTIIRDRIQQEIDKNI